MRVVQGKTHATRQRRTTIFAGSCHGYLLMIIEANAGSVPIRSLAVLKSAQAHRPALDDRAGVGAPLLSIRAGCLATRWLALAQAGLAPTSGRLSGVPHLGQRFGVAGTNWPNRPSKTSWQRRQTSTR